MGTEGLVLDELARWVGRTEEALAPIDEGPLRRLAATLDCDGDFPDGFTEVPPLWHWLYFLPLHPTRTLGDDGHATRGGFLPPVPLPRRMWAGGRLYFHRPLRVGAAGRRLSHVDAVSAKRGRSGDLVFVQVRHEIFSGEELAIVEEQDLVYRGIEAGRRAPGTPAAADESRATRHCAHDPLLFRYSALTFNTHRIHYDRRYVEEVEGYPGLVVHGPLIATLLADAVRSSHPGTRLARFEFRALSPIFDGNEFEVCARDEPWGAALWARHANGELAMRAEAHFATAASS